MFISNLEAANEKIVTQDNLEQFFKTFEEAYNREKKLLLSRVKSQPECRSSIQPKVKIEEKEASVKPERSRMTLEEIQRMLDKSDDDDDDDEEEAPKPAPSSSSASASPPPPPSPAPIASKL